MNIRKQPCAYCGKTPAGEADHVPPRGFFPKEDRNQMITIPSCGECNRMEWCGSSEEMAKDEEYTRNLFVWDYYASQHPAAKKLLTPPRIADDGTVLEEGGAAFRSAMNDPRMNKIFKDGFHLRQVQTPGGIMLPRKMLALEYDPTKFGRVVHKIIRGLYYHETGKSFPSDYKINVIVLRFSSYIDEKKIDDPAVSYLLERIFDPGPRRRADGIFSYNFASYPDDTAKSLWVLSFYDGIFLAAATYPPGEGTQIIRDGEARPPRSIVLPTQ